MEVILTWWVWLRRRDWQRGFAQEGFWNLPDAIGSYMIGLIMLSVVLALIYTGFSGGKLTQMEQGLSTMAMQIQGLY